jgi:NAD(P)-dependent dehydrogenase (short-subunit alcohol dehydrogenase family)
MSSNPVVMITGANTGLGCETLKALCRSSKAYTILLGGRNLENANAAVQTAQRDFPTSPSVLTAVQVDVESDNSISQVFEYVAKQFGRVDILINNAGNDHRIRLKDRSNLIHV